MGTNEQYRPIKTYKEVIRRLDERDGDPHGLNKMCAAIDEEVVPMAEALAKMTHNSQREWEETIIYAVMQHISGRTYFREE